MKQLLKKFIPKRFIQLFRPSIQKNKGVLFQGLPLTYNQDGLATMHNCDFMRDPHFVESYRRGKQTGSWGDCDVHWRAYVACWAANQGKRLEGDFVECGVNKGGLASTVMHYVNFETLPKKFYLLDTFCGLEGKYLTKQEIEFGRTGGGYDECYDEVLETFKQFKNVKIIRGSVPETLSQVETKKVSYLSIDMNCVIPEIAAMEFFWDKLVTGAVVVLDDYGWMAHKLQKEALDRFATKKNILILQLPTGQGIIFK